MTDYCPICNSELQWDERTGEYYCAQCGTYHSVPPEEKWVTKGWIKGLCYYNIYFDSWGFHAVRLDQVGAGRVIFGGGGMGWAYSRDKRILMQKKVEPLYLQQIFDSYPVDFEAPYDSIETVKFYGILTKKLLIKTPEAKYKFKKGYPSEETRTILQEIPYLEGKLVL